MLVNIKFVLITDTSRWFCFNCWFLDVTAFYEILVDIIILKLWTQINLKATAISLNVETQKCQRVAFIAVKHLFKNICCCPRFVLRTDD